MAQQRQDYFDALDWVTHLAVQVSIDEMGAATPCEDFNVRRLLGHLIGTAHRRLATALSAADEVHAPWAACTAMDAARGFTVETITHGWDLAVAIGQPSDAPNRIAERCLAYAGAVIPERLRGVMYDRPVAKGKASSATEQLAHLLGHQRKSS